MTRTLRYLFVLLFIGVSATAFGQAGEITGRVIDEKKEPVINAIVQAFDGGILKGTTITDYDGNYSIKPLSPSKYDVTVKLTGFKELTVTNVIVSPDKTTLNNMVMQASVSNLKEVTVVAYKNPPVDPYATGGNGHLDQETIEKAPVLTTDELVATQPGVYKASRANDGVNIGGSRTEGTLYIIDGVQVRGSYGTNMSQGSVEQIDVLTSGIPAKYGDVSGGVVNITTKGVSKDLQADVRLQHSIDGYNNNLVSFNLSGPLYKKLQADKTKKPVLGFALGGDFYYDNDRYPSYTPTYVVKPSVLKTLQQNPLTVTSDPSGNQIYTYSSEYVTKSQMNSLKVAPDVAVVEGRAHAKFDYQVNDNISITAGGNFDYARSNYNGGSNVGGGYYNTSLMFSPSSIDQQQTFVGRGFVRLTQKFGKNSYEKKEGDGAPKTGTISNAYYSLQADYQKTYLLVQDPTYKSNIFDYQYIGKFNQTFTPNYQFGHDTVTGRNGVILQSDRNPSAITFTPSGQNPNLAAYTTEYFNTTALAPTSIGQIESQHGLANGDLPALTYSLYDNIGSNMSVYSKRNYDQYSVSVDASFDLQLGKTRHNIQFGLYYQQRVEKYFSLSSNHNSSTSSIWQLMRQLTNTQLSLDKSNPIFIINGQRYSKDQVAAGVIKPSPYDTIVFNTKSGTGQSTFDSSFRKKLGLSTTGTKYLNVDAYGPDFYSLNMFSATELINGGNPNSFINYYGYTYTGATQSGNVTFNDFWTAKDANGNYTRPIAAYQPNYIAGYIQDKFEFKKDFLFNVGLRIDRFDNNTSVLKDPYSLLPEYTVSQLTATSGPVNNINGGKTPSNIGGNYVVYVDNNPTNGGAANIVGYRNGNNWYDPTGKYVEDPSVLSNYSNGRSIQPYLVDPKTKITDATFNPSSSFTSYIPQVNILPRISFSFPISDVALFFAHYDIYSQRPNTSGPQNIAYASPVTYFYLNPGQIIGNPNLKPTLTYDYEFGFTQKLSERSAVTLSAFYKERKNQVAISQLQDAYPYTYLTYNNTDFSTTKGVSLKYDLRRIQRIRMTISYTLQFAEGTGSSINSGNGGNQTQLEPNGLLQNFIEAGLPNLRYSSPLTFDSRHNVVANVDYRFAKDDGPMIGGKHIFENTGLNLIASARSGEPYTRYSVPDVVTHAVIGGANGSRLPWHYNLDLKLDKDFVLNFSRKHADGETGLKPKKIVALNVFIYAQNVLNIRDVLSVYGYTGRADDNGYLTSSYGISKIPTVTSPASYQDLYQIAYNNPNNYNVPRTITLGLQFNF